MLTLLPVSRILDLLDCLVPEAYENGDAAPRKRVSTLAPLAALRLYHSIGLLKIQIIFPVSRFPEAALIRSFAHSLFTSYP